MIKIYKTIKSQVYTEAINAEHNAKWTRNIARSGGAVSSHHIMKECPAIDELYKELLPICQEILSEPKLRLCPPFDQHSSAIYYYKRPGDGCKWHTDKCWYKGRRYTVLVGIENIGVKGHSSALLEYILNDTHRHDPIMPGEIRLFNDQLLHMVHPLQKNENRIVISFTYITDETIAPYNRICMEFKDNYGYFGIPTSWITTATIVFVLICILLYYKKYI